MPRDGLNATTALLTPSVRRVQTPQKELEQLSQSAGTVRSRAHMRRASTCSAITTDSGLVPSISANSAASARSSSLPKAVKRADLTACSISPPLEASASRRYLRPLQLKSPRLPSAPQSGCTRLSRNKVGLAPGMTLLTPSTHSSLTRCKALGRPGHEIRPARARPEQHKARTVAR